jgi:hypothetical protein
MTLATISFAEIQRIHDERCRAKGIDTYDELVLKMCAFEFGSTFIEPADGWDFVKRFLEGDESAVLQAEVYRANKFKDQ